jgi:uncharacterized membrane protein (GlpM family)
MFYFAIKTIITVALVVAISEIAKRSSFMAGLLASIPLTSLLALMWLQIESGDIERTADLSTSIFWLIPPSLIFLGALPFLLRANIQPAMAFLGAVLLTGAGYWIYLQVLGAIGIKL